MSRNNKFVRQYTNSTIKFRTKNRVEIIDDARRTYNKNSQIKFKTLIPKLSLCDYCDAYIILSGAITIDGSGVENN